MKQFKTLVALVLAVMMVLSLASVAFADEGDAITATTGSITIQNAARGETYKIYKIFDATISKVEGANGVADSVAYTYSDTLPSTLAAVFEKIGTTNYVKRIDGKTDEEVIAAVKNYLNSLADDATTAAAPQTGDGSPVVFDNLPFGYYGVKSSQGSAVTIDSANPDAVIYDKNSTTVTAHKDVEDTSYSIGDTIKYTGTFNTTNWMGSGADAKQVTKYKIDDTLPAFLSNVEITSVKILTGTDDPATEDDERTVVATLTSNYTAEDFGDDKAIFIQWADYDSTNDTWTSKYPNGAIIEIQYEGTLTSVTNIGKNDVNTITITPYVTAPEGDDDDDDDDDDDKPWEDHWSDHKEIKTYAAALKKVDGEGSDANGLAGAKFKFTGLTATKDADGVYTVTSVNATAGTETELEVNSDGMLYIIGLADDASLTGTETEAPAGYNKLTSTFTLTPQLLSTEIFKKDGYRKYDSQGNIIEESETETTGFTKVTENLSALDPQAIPVVNNKGAELPSTGGIGTTIFYVAGIVLILGAAAVVIARRKAEN